MKSGSKGRETNNGKEDMREGREKGARRAGRRVTVRHIHTEAASLCVSASLKVLRGKRCAQRRVKKQPKRLKTVYGARRVLIITWRPALGVTFD